MPGQCQRCSHETSVYIYTPNKKIWVCDNCSSKYQVCMGCNYYFRTEQLTHIKGWFYCQDCKDKLHLCCKGCGKRVFSIITHNYNGDKYCDKCYSDLTVKCVECNEETKVDETYEYDGDKYCGDCYHDLFAECYLCGGVNSVDDTLWVDNDAICDGCYDLHYTECTNCDKIIKKRDSRAFDGDYYCDDCFWDRHDECEECGNIERQEDMYYNNDVALCYRCHEKENSAIKNYEYKPSALYHTASGVFDHYHHNSKYIYYGFELEVENYKNIIGCNDMAELLEENFGKFLYYKWDGSLNNGFEIISHPFTWEWFKKNRGMLKEMLKLLIEKGYCSYYSNTAAIHIHVSKKPFKTFHLFKLLEFYYGHERLIKLFSRIYHKKKTNQRVNWKWNKKNTKIAARYKHHDYDSDNDFDRYQMVNLENSNTIEFRSFRGTLKSESFFRILELIKVSIDYCEESSLKDITKLYPTFYNYIKKRQKEFRNLYSFLLKKKGEVEKRCV